MTHILALTEGVEAREAVIAVLEPTLLFALGDRVVSADGVDATAVALLPGVLSVVTQDTGRQIGDVGGLLADPASARAVLGALLGVDGSTVDDDTLGDILGWLDSVSADFTAQTSAPPGDGLPWPFEGGCLDPEEPPPPPPPDSPLRAARFAGDPVLEDCLANVHRMMAPEQGVAVLKIQQALLDLGFALPDHGADSIFGAETGAAVSEFKRRNALAPDDPVVAHGTMQRLDQIFA